MFALGPVERLAPTPVLPYSSSLFTAINFPPQASMNISVDFIATIDSLKQDLFHKYDPSIAPVHSGGAAELFFSRNFLL